MEFDTITVRSIIVKFRTFVESILTSEDTLIIDKLLKTPIKIYNNWQVCHLGPLGIAVVIDEIPSHSIQNLEEIFDIPIDVENWHEDPLPAKFEKNSTCSITILRMIFKQLNIICLNKKMQLPPDVFTIIGAHCDFYTLQSLRSTCSGIRRRVHVTKLPWELESRLDDNSIGYFPNLTILYIGSNLKITNAGMMSLKYLTELYASHNTNITDDGISHLTHLTILTVSFTNISDECIEKLTNLVTISAVGNSFVSDYNKTRLKPKIVFYIKIE